MKMKPNEVEEHFNQAMEAIDDGGTFSGLAEFEGKLAEGKELLFYSYLAVNMVREGGECEASLAIMRQVQDAEPTRPVHYLNLGRIYVACGNKPQAIRSFRNGLLFGFDRRLHHELDNLGWRRMPVFRSLPRHHVVNVLFGLVRNRLIRH
jgi:hypothetical protein